MITGVNSLLTENRMKRGPSGKPTRDEHMKNVTEGNKKDMTLPTEMMILKREKLTMREVKVT